MKITRLLYVLSILLVGCSTTEYPDISIDELPKSQMEFQKMIIAQLTGETSIKTVDNDPIFINSRWNAQEKELTSQYLTHLLEKIGVQSGIHTYSLPNSNFAVDLLIAPLHGSNIYATLPATTGSDEYVILGAHYDTGGKDIPGAIDNGSGIALILSVLRQASQLASRGKNIMVVFFDQEEEGVSAGSIAFAKYLNKTAVNIYSVHTFDLIGWDSDNNKEVELELPSKEIESIYNNQAALLDIPIYTTSINSSDHYSFIKEGINAVGVSQAYGKGDNSGKKDTPEDTYHIVNFEFIESATTLAFGVVKEIIND